MKLYYDRLSRMFSLDMVDSVAFLGGMTHALLKLKEFGLTDSQAREATLQAVFNMGDAVDLEIIKKIA